MPQPSVFGEEWRECQREHYRQAVCSGDARRRADLADALRSVGFSETELSSLYLAATMHSDDVPGEFLPDLKQLEAQRRELARHPHPDECMCPSCVPSITFDQD